MNVDLDRWYAEGCGALPTEQQELARSLPFRLGLAPSRDVRWSETFQHPITLAAPSFFADCMPHADEQSVRHATISHMFAVIEAFTTDRVQDGQITDADGSLRRLAGSFRFIRDNGVQNLDIDGRSAFAIADRDVRDAHERESEFFRTRRAVPFHRYEKVSLQKQAVGFPATLALARAARIPARRPILRQTLASIWLGLQLADDVIDWEEDYARGGAWVVCIARGLGEHLAPNASLAEARDAVFASGAMARMLERAKEHFASCLSGARELAATTLADWAEAQHQRMAELETGERESPGYAIRAHKLRHFAREVLS